MYTKEFEIRWSDVDANRHLMNSAYINYLSHTRMSFFSDNGFGQSELAKLNIGPVALSEHMYYFKEVFPGNPIRVSIQLKGISENGMFFEFLHNFYDSKGRNIARCEMMGAWIDLKDRKLRGLPDNLLTFLERMDKAAGFKIISKEETRKYGQVPIDL
jgi:acyl-CoA thioester hydrolase